MPPSLISEVIAKESENQFYNFVNGTFILFYFLSCNYSPPPTPAPTHTQCFEMDAFSNSGMAQRIELDDGTCNAEADNFLDRWELMVGIQELLLLLNVRAYWKHGD